MLSQDHQVTGQTYSCRHFRYTFCLHTHGLVSWLVYGNRRVQGLDATAARTFYSLRSALERLGVELILTHMPTTR